MKYDLVVKGGKVVLPGITEELNIGVMGEQVDTLTRNEISGREEIDATGRHVIPGAIDPHMHTWSGHNFETFENGSLASAKGGVTTIIDMPLDVPVPDSTSTIRQKVQSGGETSYVDFALLGGLTPDSIVRIGEMAEAGVVGYKVFMDNLARKGFYEGLDAGQLLEAMELVAQTTRTMCIHAENSFIIDRLSPRLQSAGRENPDVWCDARPPISEIEAVSRAVLLAEKTKCRVNLVHLSLGEAVEIVASARKRGNPIYAETAPHYLLLSRNDLAKDKRLRCNPPLRDPTEVEALWNSLRRGDINMIGSDHAPLPKDMQKNIWEIFGGLGDVVEVMVAVLFSEAMFNRNIGIEALVDLCCSTPARVFGLYPTKGVITPGSDADLVVLEVGSKKTLTASDLQMLGDTWSAYDGWTIRVSPEITILRGKVIIDKGEVCGSPGQGEFVSPQT